MDQHNRDSQGFESGTGATQGIRAEQRIQQADPQALRVREQKYAYVGEPEAIAKLIAAWAKAQEDFEEIGRDADGQIGHRNFKYAPLVNLTKATRRHLAKNGIITLQFVTTLDKTWDVFHTHVCGHGARLEFSHEFEKPTGLRDDQRDSGVVNARKEWGKLTTYMRRYDYQMVHVLDGEPDADDGGAERPQQPQRNREAPTPQRQETGRATRPNTAPEGTDRPNQQQTRMAPPAERPPQRPQEAPKPVPTQTQRPASQPPPAQAPAPAPARPEPTNAELAGSLGMEVETVDVGHQSIVQPKNEPVVDRDPDTFDVTKLSAQELEDAIKINGRAIRITRADVDALYRKVSNDQTMTMQRASRNVHELALVELMERRREMEASGA